MDQGVIRSFKAHFRRAQLNAIDGTGDDYIDNISIVKSVLEQHNLLHSDSASNEDDFGEILPLVTVEQANQAITDLINLFSIESFLSTKLQSTLLCNL